MSKSKQTLASREWKTSDAYFKIVNRGNRVEAFVSIDGRDWQSLAADIDVSDFNHNRLHGYQCVRPALAASGNGNAHFADFRYRKL